jgi:ribosomal protein S18 acetylase RimI-like enzyme
MTRGSSAGDGTAVGAGVCSSPVDGLSELAGLAVAESSRRRGIGAMLSAYLTAPPLRTRRRPRPRT